MNEAIVVALITAIGGIVVGMMQLFKNEARENAKENREDHAIVQQQLRMIFKSVNKIDTKVEKHLDQHAEGLFNGKTINRDS